MKFQLTCGGLLLVAALVAGCGGVAKGPKVTAAEQKALPADAELIVASAVCPRSLVESERDPRRREQDLMRRQNSKVALLALKRAVQAHPSYTVQVERHSSDEAPYVWHEDISVLDLAKEQREEAVYAATTPGSGTESAWAQCRQRLATRLDALINEAE